MTTHRPAARFASLSLLLLLAAPFATAQSLFEVSLTTLGTATEDTGNPNFPRSVLFVGQPAVFIFEVTNNGPTPQMMLTGGGGGGGFVVERVTLNPPETGTCTLDESGGNYFFDCDFMLPGTETASGKTNGANTAEVIVELDPTDAGVEGGLSYSAGNGETGNSASRETRTEEVTETRMLTAATFPGFIEILHTTDLEGLFQGSGSNAIPFVRRYPEGMNIGVSAPVTINVNGETSQFSNWLYASGDAAPFRNSFNPLLLTMDRDWGVTAVYQGKQQIAAVSGGPEGFKANGVTGLDIYVNGERLVDDLNLDQASPFLDLPLQADIDVTDGSASDNSNPLQHFVFEGQDFRSLLILTETDHFLNLQAHEVARNANRADLTLFLYVPDETLETLRMVHRTAAGDTELFGPSQPVNEERFLTSYVSVPPGESDILVLDRASGALLESFRTMLDAGAAILGVLRQSGGKQQVFEMLLFDAEGGPAITPPVVTDADAGTDVPAAFVLHPNHPNPFNPTTTLVFDLPGTATVRVEVFDLLGRHVLALPPRRVEAGAGRTLAVEASALASGVYLYRIQAETATGRRHTATGRMVLVK